MYSIIKITYSDVIIKALFIVPLLPEYFLPENRKGEESISII
jgi:hypothetical protein